MMDYEKIKAGVQLMLEGIGEDVTREGLLETPDRIARMCAEIYGGLYEDESVHLKKQFTVERNDIVSREGYHLLFRVRTSFTPLLRKSTYRVYTER